MPLRLRTVSTDLITASSILALNKHERSKFIRKYKHKLVKTYPHVNVHTHIHTHNTHTHTHTHDKVRTYLLIRTQYVPAAPVTAVSPKTTQKHSCQDRSRKSKPS